MISVIIPTYRNPKYLDLCLTSILNGQKNKNQIIVVVDGFVEESEDVLSKHKGIDVIRFDENQGFQAALNIGTWSATNEKIFIVNDDNVFPENWDTRIEEQYQPNQVMTVNQIEPTGPGMFNFPVVNCGRNTETFDMGRFQSAETSLSKNLVTPDGSIFPFLLSKRWYMAVGGFDTFYNSPNLCDWDFFAKLQLIPSVELVRIHQVHLYHFGSVATKKNSEADSFRAREQFAMEQYYYKWGYPPHNGKDNSKFPVGVKSIRGM
jgi:glycosyltransferase involved in cell wall biosynthesis